MFVNKLVFYNFETNFLITAVQSRNMSKVNHENSYEEQKTEVTPETKETHIEDTYGL